CLCYSSFFFFSLSISTNIYPLSLHDALPIYVDLPTLFSESDVISLHCPLTPENYHLLNEAAFDQMKNGVMIVNTSRGALIDSQRSEEHTSELQSRFDLVCRLLLEKKKKMSN